MHVETVTVGAFEVNCFIVWSRSARALVIDPGDDAPRIADALSRHGLTVAVYLLTHGHVDHVSGLADLWQSMPAPVAIHPRDLAWAFAPENEFPPYYPPVRKPPAEFRELAGGDVTDFEDMTCRVLETPGHTPGSVCLWFEASGALFTGDTLFAGSVGRTDLTGGNAQMLAASLKKLKALPDATRVYPGHGPQTTIGEEKRSNFFMRTPPG